MYNLARFNFIIIWYKFYWFREMFPDGLWRTARDPEGRMTCLHYFADEVAMRAFDANPDQLHWCGMEDDDARAGSCRKPFVDDSVAIPLH